MLTPTTDSTKTNSGLAPVVPLWPRVQSVGDRYTLVEPLAWGGQAWVYKGYDEVLHRAVAVKLLRGGASARAIERFEVEALAVSGIHHPNVLATLDWGRGNTQRSTAPSYLVTEWVPGITLAEFLEHHGPLLPEAVSMLGWILAEALSAVHAAGVVHRDVKPANILLDERRPGRIVLADFGVAYWLDGVTARGGRLTNPGERLGTTPYMSPEQVLGGPVDPRSDVFSLGVMLYELVAGERLFSGDEEAVTAAICAGRYALHMLDTPRIPDYLREAISRCLRREPVERWQTMGDLAAAFTEGLQSEELFDPHGEVGAYLKDPPGYTALLEQRLFRLSLFLARAALRHEPAPVQRAAVLHWGMRALGLRPDDPEVHRLLQEVQADHLGIRCEGDNGQAVMYSPLGGVVDRQAAPVPGGMQVRQPLDDGNSPRSTERAGPHEARHRFLVAILPIAIVMGIVAVVSGMRGPYGGPGDKPGKSLPVQSVWYKPGLSYMPVAPIAPGDNGPYQTATIPGADRNASGSVAEIDSSESESPAWMRGGNAAFGDAQTLNLAVDEAARALAQGRSDDAFREAERVLEKSPENRLAHWARSLALSEMGLSYLAMQDVKELSGFEGDTGWTQQALQRVEAVHASERRRHDSWRSLIKAGHEMILGGAVLPPSTVWAWPGRSRLFFYDAARAAADVQRLKALLPLAQELDRYYGGSVLVRYEERLLSAGVPLVRRALARTYARLAVERDSLSRREMEQYLRRLKQSGQVDLWMGALVLTSQVRSQILDYRNAAHASGDPWFILLAETELANVELAQGKTEAAESRLMSVLQQCRNQNMGFRCGWAMLARAELFYMLERWPEAEAQAREGRWQAQKSGDWDLEVNFLRELGRVLYRRQNGTLTQAYITEASLRDPMGCMQARDDHILNAAAAIDTFRFDDARHEMLLAPTCNEPMTLLGLEVLSHLERRGQPLVDVEVVRRELARLRRNGRLSKVELARTFQIEGVLLLRNARVEALALLRKAIAQTEAMPHTDATARRVRATSYEEIALVGAADVQYDQALSTWISAWNMPIDRPCVLGVVIAGERMFVGLRGQDGKTHAQYKFRDSMTLPSSTTLIPTELQGPLVACSQVAVLTQSWLHERADLLDSSVVWAFYGQREKNVSSHHMHQSAAHALVVSNVRPPLEFFLGKSLDFASFPRMPYRYTRINEGIRKGGTSVILTGADATPGEVLAQLKKADQVMLSAPLSIEESGSALVLSPDGTGSYQLRTTELATQELESSPLIFLQTFSGQDESASESMLATDAPWSLPSVLIEAGAHAVLSMDGTLPGETVKKLFEEIAPMVREGKSLAQAVHLVRSWTRSRKNRWAKHVCAFQ